MIYNGIIHCSPDEVGFHIESDSSQGFALMTSQGVFLATVASGSIILDKFINEKSISEFYIFL